MQPPWTWPERTSKSSTKPTTDISRQSRRFGRCIYHCVVGWRAFPEWRRILWSSQLVEAMGT